MEHRINKKIAFVSLGSGGTMGHFSFIQNIVKKIHNNFKEILIISEYDYKDHTNFRSNNVKWLKVTSRKHQKSISGNLDHKSSNEIYQLLKKENVSDTFFSTFFDTNLIKMLDAKKINSYLLSYPLRDNFFELFILKKFNKYFKKVFILSDLHNIHTDLKNNMMVVNPVQKEINYNLKISSNSKKKILILVGGGGRPSSEKFLNMVEKSIFELSKNKNIYFKIITGFSNKKLSISGPNIEIINWTKNIEKEYINCDFVISEAGYNTILELILFKKPAIIIPGARRMDNQELRAIEFEKRGMGYCVLPEENYTSLNEKFFKLLDKQDLTKKIKSFSKHLNSDNTKKGIIEVIMDELK
jgi:UDP-N-acetylglucosamine:LPS N-acetylglucosamine transferase